MTRFEPDSADGTSCKITHQHQFTGAPLIKRQRGEKMWTEYAAAQFQTLDKRHKSKRMNKELEGSDLT